MMMEKEMNQSTSDKSNNNDVHSFIENAETWIKNRNNKYNGIELFNPTFVVYSPTTNNNIENSMKELEDIEQKQILYYAQRAHRKEIYNSNYKPTLQEKEEITNLLSLFTSNKNTNKSLQSMINNNQK